MKSFKQLSTYLNLLVWLGPMFIIAGLSAGVVSGGWSAVPMGMIFAGIAVIGLWLILLGRVEATKTQPKFWKRRTTQAGANALVATLAVLVILGLINFLGTKYVWRTDLTENQQFTLAPQTQEIVRNLQQPIKVWVFDPQQNPQDRELLEGYRRLGKNLSFAFVDPQAEPNLASKLEVKSIGDVVLELQSNQQRKQFVQRVGQEGRLSEGKLTNAIEQITSDRRNTVYFLQGHGERPVESGQQGTMSQAVKLLGEKNFVGKPLNLATSKQFPTDASVVIVAGLQKPLLAAELKEFKEYLDRGGNGLLMVDPSNQNPKLDDLLNDWGVTLDKRVAIDASGSGKQFGLGPADVVVTQYGNHPITKELQGNISFFSLARPIETKPVNEVKSTVLFYSSANSWAESNLQSQPLAFNPPADAPGPLALGVALTRPVTPKPSEAKPSVTKPPAPKPSVTAPSTDKPSTDKKESRLVVIGNSTFATDGLFDQVVNGDVFLNSVSWLSQRDQPTLSVRPKEAKNRRINLSTQQALLSGWLALVILPILGFGTAVVVWWQRR